MIKFNKYNIEAGGVKSKVSYWAASEYDGRKVIFINAKDYGATALRVAFPDKWRNDTDSQADYFDKDSVKLYEGDEHYAEALARAEKNAEDWDAREEKKRLKRLAR